MSEDDGRPGSQWRGATWIEFYGGPWDGTMVEERFPLQFLGKITAWPRGTTPQAIADGSTFPLGEYHPVAWADEDLKIVKLEWRGIPQDTELPNT